MASDARDDSDIQLLHFLRFVALAMSDTFKVFIWAKLTGPCIVSIARRLCTMVSKLSCVPVTKFCINGPFGNVSPFVRSSARRAFTTWFSSCLIAKKNDRWNEIEKVFANCYLQTCAFFESRPLGTVSALLEVVSEF